METALANIILFSNEEICSKHCSNINFLLKTTESIYIHCTKCLELLCVAIQERYAGVDAPGPYADSHLVNGRGRFNNTAPLEVHRVEQGRVYLFRFINAGFDDEYGVCTMHSESK